MNTQTLVERPSNSFHYDFEAILILISFELYDFYLCDFPGIGSSSFQNFNFLIDIWRVQPALTITTFAEVSLFPKPKNVNDQDTCLLVTVRDSHPCLYISSSSNKYPNDDTAGGHSTSLLAFGTSCLTNGLR